MAFYGIIGILLWLSKRNLAGFSEGFGLAGILEPL